jgi:hypothetical protein
MIDQKIFSEGVNDLLIHKAGKPRNPVTPNKTTNITIRVVRRSNKGSDFLGAGEAGSVNSFAFDVSIVFEDL